MSSKEEKYHQKSKKRKCTIESVYMQSPGLLEAHPLLVSFRTPHPQNCDLTATIEREPFSRSLHPNHKYQSHVTITTDDARDYVGQRRLCIEKSEDEIILIGALDKTTGSLKLVEAEQFTVSRKLDRSAQLFLQTDSEKMPEANVNVVFGTKKSLMTHKVHVQEKERHNVEVLTAIQSASAVVNTSGRAQAEDGSDYSYIVPPCNEAAATAQEVYSMESIVEDPVLECFIDEATELLENPIPEDAGFSPLGLVSLACAKVEADEDTRLRHACAILYMRLLAKIVSGKKIDQESADEMVTKYLHTNYRAMSKFCPPSMKDRALTHLLVLALLVNRCRIPVVVLVNSITIPRSKLLMFLRVLRVQVKKADALLQLPLPDVAEKVTMKRLNLNKKSKR